MSISDWIHQTADTLVANNLQSALFGLLVLLAFVEAAAFVGFVLPGETALLLGGVLAQAGVWNLWVFLAASVAAAIAGDSVGYEIGKHLGPKIKKNAFGRLVGQKRWKLAQAIFDRYHGGAIFFGRAQGLLRALVPALAGMNRVPYRTFLFWNAAGATVFSPIVVFLGYEFANSLPTLERYLRYWAIFFLIVVVIVVLFLKRKLKHLLTD